MNEPNDPSHLSVDQVRIVLVVESWNGANATLHYGSNAN